MKMKVTVDLSDWIVNALLAWRIPPELAGPSIEDRLIYLAEETAQSLLTREEWEKRVQLYLAFGLRLDDDDESDDDIDM
ncbi:MAG: hypothetical protein AB7E05_07150 [Sphingobium sp.]